MRTHGSRSIPKRRGRVVKALRRQIHLPSGVWTWEMRRIQILIRNPDGSKTWTVTHSEMTGWSWYELERAHWKRAGNRPVHEGGHQITPKVVKDWIEKHCMG